MTTPAAHPFFVELDRQIEQLGGMFNAHLHLDRAGTWAERYQRPTGSSPVDNSHISLARKHALIGVIHSGPAYESEDLTERVNQYLQTMIDCRTFRADTLVDVTDDCVGLTALETLQGVQSTRRGEIDLRIAAYTPLGFNDAEPGRWEVFAEGARRSDFIASLPEADDQRDYPENIGFMEHCRRVLELASDLGKMIHVHTDQRFEDSERGTEQLIEAVREYGGPAANDDGPMVWAIHVVSPSTFDEARFQRMIEGLLETKIGVIVCPSAALGMRQLRPLPTPTGNSIPRVLEMIAAGVHVRLGSDNIADMCSPSTTADLRDEVLCLSSALRFYDVEILARLCSGQQLSDAERQRVRSHLREDAAEVERTLQRLGRVASAGGRG